MPPRINSGITNDVSLFETYNNNNNIKAGKINKKIKIDSIIQVTFVGLRLIILGYLPGVYPRKRLISSQFL